uniref:hypothetical protein n=2 Tax=Faecalibaculum rodentium TaxID=1702221 RepID=UPI00272AE86B
MKCAKLMTALVSASCLLAGCASGPADDKIQIEIVSYKPEAAKVFEEIQDLFNETHDDIHRKRQIKDVCMKRKTWDT